MVLLRKLVLSTLENNLHLNAVHVPGCQNIICDKLSRGQVPVATLASLGIGPTPSPVPAWLRPHNFKMT